MTATIRETDVFSDSFRMLYVKLNAVSAFTTAHTHYNASGGSTGSFALSYITAAKQHLKHHGYGGRFIGFINSDMTQKIEDAAAWTTTNLPASKVIDNVAIEGFAGRLLGIDPKTLFGVNNIGISDSFSFWAWKRTVVWKNTGEKKSTKILKHIAAQGAFLGIGTIGCVETVGRFLGRPIAAGINYLRYKEFDNRHNTAVRLSATATVEAITGLVTKFFPGDFEATACSSIAKGVMKITENRLTL